MHHLTYVLLLLFSLSALAQKTTDAPVLTHKKKAYLDTARNRLYWPLDNPIWVRLAESPDKDAVSYLLSRDSDSVGRASTGIKLDLSGSQFIRWRNFLTGDSVKLRFYADGDPPECSIKLRGEKTRTKPTGPTGEIEEKASLGDKLPSVCYARKVIAAVSGNDRHSGVDAYYVSINGAPYAPVTGDITFDKEAVYRVSYYGVDKVGNASAPEIQTFSIDATPPKSLLVFNGRVDAADTVFSRSQSIEFKAVDTLSGIEEIFYWFDDKKKIKKYKEPVPLKSLKDGPHAVWYYAVDKAGNEEKPKRRPFVVDDIAPVPEISLVGDRYQPEKGLEYISPRTVVKLAAVDNKSGIAQIRYAIENKDFIDYTSPFRFSTKLDKCALEVVAIDKAGNKSPKYKTTARMDAKPPKTSYEISGPLVKKSGILYLSSASRIELSSRDEGSGVAATSYFIDNTAPKPYSGPFAIAQEGQHLFRFWSMDRVNNAEDTPSVVIVVDNTPPRIVETFSVQVSSSDTANNKKPKFPPNTSLFLAASDASGVEGIWYSINGKRKEKYSRDLKFEKPGDYEILVTAKDILGTTQEKKLEFAIAP